MDAGPADGRDLRRKRLLGRATQHPDVYALGGEALGQRRVVRRWPAFTLADGTWRHGDHGAIRREGTLGAPRFRLRPGNNELRQWPFGREGRSGGQGQRGALIDHPGQGALSPPHVIEQEKPPFAEEADALRNAGEKRRERRFPSPGHHERGAVALGPQPPGEVQLKRKREPPAWQVHHYALPHAWHVV